MDASGKIRVKSLKLAKFPFQLFLVTFDIMDSLYIWHNACNAISTVKYLRWYLRYCFVPWGPNAKLILQCDFPFWRNMQIFRTKLLHLSVFLVKQFTGFIYVKQKLFCLVNWAYPFVGPPGPISFIKMHIRNKKDSGTGVFLWIFQDF